MIEIQKDELATQDPENTRNNALHGPIVRLAGLSKNFTEAGQVRSGLTDINLEINNGEFIALLGQSGSGKSTLLNLISGIERPTSGSVIISGEDITSLQRAG